MSSFLLVFLLLLLFFFLQKEINQVAEYLSECNVKWEFTQTKIQGVPLATEPGISLIIFPPIRILHRNLKRTTDTFLFISYTTNVLLFKFRCKIFIGVRIIKQMPGWVASGTHWVFSMPKDRQRIILEGRSVQIFGNKPNLSKIIS